MVYSRKNPRFRQLSYQQVLNTRIGDLPLRPEGTLRQCLIQLRRELKRRHISFFPHFYFGEEPWGCIDMTGSVEIPFYLANSTLRRIGEQYYLSYTKKEIMMLLRHETGHAINYAYRLWSAPEWKEMFGNFRKRYPNLYNFNPRSKEYVRYLHYIGSPHYAQKHPDDDFAETFALWLDPTSKWRWNYRNWEVALNKLQFVDRIFRREKLALRRPLKIRYDDTSSHQKIRSTIARYFNIEKEVDPRIREYTQDMKEIFSKLNPRRSRRLIRADLFIQNYTEYLEDELVTWIAKATRRDVRSYLRELRTICALNNLSLLPDQATEKLVELVIVSTYHIFQRLRILR